jgi:acyl dehydratase
LWLNGIRLRNVFFRPRNLAHGRGGADITEVISTPPPAGADAQPLKEDTMAGKYFDELEVGQVYKHQPGRTVTETDNLLFSTLTLNMQPLHLDAEFSKNAEFGQRLVNSIFTLGLAVGVSVADTTLGTTVGNLGFEKVEFPKPVFIGDTIYAETEVVEKRESKSRPQWGVIIFEHRATNQRGEVVMRCRRAGMMRKKGA